MSIASASVTEGNVGTVTVAVTVTLSAASTATVTVNYATANGTATAGSDYQSASGTLSFAPGVMSRSFTVTIIGDRVKEANETILVTLTSPTGATLAAASATVTILDDERALTATQAAATPSLAAAQTQASGTAEPTTAPSQTDLQALAGAALRRLPLTDAQRALLATVDVRVADLPGLALGEYRDGAVLIDADAAGHGWFIDTTPGDDAEFGRNGGALLATSKARGEMDLLSVLVHEFGHAAGLEHDEGGVMAELLVAGLRTAAAPGVVMPRMPAGSDVSAFAALQPAGFEMPDVFRGAQSRPVIDWSNGSTRTVAAEASASKWVGDFINHLGKTEAQRNPNAALRLQVDAAPKVTPRLSVLMD